MRHQVGQPISRSCLACSIATISLPYHSVVLISAESIGTKMAVCAKENAQNGEIETEKRSEIEKMETENCNSE